MKRALAILIPLALAACTSTGTRRTILTNKAPRPIGPYSQAVQVGDTLYAAGQVGADPQSGELVAGGIQAETRQALRNLTHVLAEAGFKPSDVTTVSVYLADLAEFAAMNEVYTETFGDAPPARATIEVAGLPKGARVEITLIAVRAR